MGILCAVVFLFLLFCYFFFFFELGQRPGCLHCFFWGGLGFFI
jgi:hypothetical protein